MYGTVGYVQIRLFIWLLEKVLEKKKCSWPNTEGEAANILKNFDALFDFCVSHIYWGGPSLCQNDGTFFAVIQNGYQFKSIKLNDVFRYFPAGTELDAQVPTTYTSGKETGLRRQGPD